MRGDHCCRLQMGGFGGLGDAHLDDVADLWLPRLLSVKGRVSPSYLINAGSILGGGVVVVVVCLHCSHVP